MYMLSVQGVLYLSIHYTRVSVLVSRFNYTSLIIEFNNAAYKISFIHVGTCIFLECSEVLKVEFQHSTDALHIHAFNHKITYLRLKHTSMNMFE